MSGSEGKPGIKERLVAKVDAARRRSPFFNQVVSTYEHYTNVEGNMLAGAVTYFGYLSFFPVLALGFAIMGFATRIYPDADDKLVDALATVLPGLVGLPGSGAMIETSVFTDAAGTATVIGLAGLLYSGLGWLSGLRDALQAVFAVPPGQQHNFVVGKAFDLVTLAVLGLVLMVSVALSGAVGAVLDTVKDWVGVGDNAVTSLLLGAVGILLGIAASTLLFVAMFKLLPKPDLPMTALLKGALFGAVLFEVLKFFATFLISLAEGNAAAALGVTSIVLLVWINYFSRIALLSASWASMTAEGREMIAAREVQEVERIVAGDPVVPGAIGGFRKASTEEGAAAPWPPEVDEEDRHSGP